MYFTREVQDAALQVLEGMGFANCGVYGVWYESGLHVMCCFTLDDGGLQQQVFPLPFGESARVVQQRVSGAWGDSLLKQLGGAMPKDIYFTTYKDDENRTTLGPSVKLGEGELASVEPMLGGAALRTEYATMRVYDVSPGVMCCLSRVAFS